MLKNLSAVIITKNEEAHIGRCLTSLSEWVPDIVVVDSESTDKTQQICKQFKNVNFITHPWTGFSNQKNYGNNRAKFDFILSIDADEEISTELRASIESLDGKFTDMVAYKFNRRTQYCGAWINHCGWYPDTQLRLFSRRTARWNRVQVHEEIELNPTVRTEWIDGDLKHYSYDSIEEHIDRMNRYTSLGAQRVVDAGEKALLAKACFNSLNRFVRCYFVRLGFLDGWRGLVISVFAGISVFMKYTKAFVSQRMRDER